MPAVELTRLKSQLGELSWKFAQPDDFQSSLRELFERYSERVYRPGQNIQADRIHPAYHISNLVMRRLELELAERGRENPAAALALADKLWRDSYLETRQVAAFLLGLVPVEQPDAVADRLRSWAQPNEDKQALRALMSAGAQRLRREAIQVWLNLVKEWTDSPYPSVQAVGLIAIQPAILDDHYDYFPPIFQMSSGLLQNSTAMTQDLLLETLQALARRTPRETAYFLRQLLSISPRPAFIRLVRKSLPAFPEEIQENLKRVIKNLPV